MLQRISVHTVNFVDRCNLNLDKKLQMIQAAFGYIGKPSIFNRILYMCPDVEMLLDHAASDTLPALTGGDGRTNTQKTHVLESVETLAREKIKTGKITAVQHDLMLYSRIGSVKYTPLSHNGSIGDKELES